MQQKKKKKYIRENNLNVIKRTLTYSNIKY